MMCAHLGPRQLRQMPRVLLAANGANFKNENRSTLKLHAGWDSRTWTAHLPASVVVLEALQPARLRQSNVANADVSHHMQAGHGPPSGLPLAVFLAFYEQPVMCQLLNQLSDTLTNSTSWQKHTWAILATSKTPACVTGSSFVSTTQSVHKRVLHSYVQALGMFSEVVMALL